MADTQTYPDQNQQFAEDLDHLDIAVYPGGDPSGFHMQNEPGHPFERDGIIERKGHVDIRCDHKDIIHGFFSDKPEASPCSLIVLEFCFLPNGIFRRVKEAHVVIKFAAKEKKTPDPEVIAIHPDGYFFVEPTLQYEKNVVSTGVDISGGLSGVVQTGAHLKMESTVERDTSDATKIKGSRDVRGRNWGAKNSVSWSFTENTTTKTGVVTTFRAPILLKRWDMNHFRACVSIKVKADTKTSIESIFKADPKDDDVWYDPSRSPTNRLQKYDANNLGSFDLKSASDVTLFTVLQSAVKKDNE